MLTTILIVLAVVIIGLVIVVSLRPAEFRVMRSTRIVARPEAVFAEVNDLHRWEAWSPWAKLDPNAKSTYEGPRAGVGAVFAWSGNNQVGEGRMTIVESRPNELVGFKLEFTRPFKATNAAEFTFRPEGNQTVVTWTMSGKNNFLSKAMGLFVNCDTMVGGQFEKGLTTMKSVVETETKEPAVTSAPS
jgi:hypothetical protein